MQIVSVIIFYRSAQPKICNGLLDIVIQQIEKDMLFH